MAPNFGVGLGLPDGSRAPIRTGVRDLIDHRGPNFLKFSRAPEERALATLPAHVDFTKHFGRAAR